MGSLEFTGLPLILVSNLRYLFLIVNIFFYFPNGACFAVSIHFSLKIAIPREYATIFIHFIFHQYILQPSKTQSKAVLRSVEMCPLFSRHCNKMLDSPSIFICNANFVAVIFNRQRYNQNILTRIFLWNFLRFLFVVVE